MNMFWPSFTVVFVVNAAWCKTSYLLRPSVVAQDCNELFEVLSKRATEVAFVEPHYVQVGWGNGVSTTLECVGPNLALAIGGVVGDAAFDFVYLGRTPRQQPTLGYRYDLAPLSVSSSGDTMVVTAGGQFGLSFGYNVLICREIGGKMNGDWMCGQDIYRAVAADESVIVLRNEEAYLTLSIPPEW